MIRFLLKLSLISFFTITLVYSYVHSVQAATILVNTADDINAPSDGKCGLREAIENANANTQLHVECAAGQAFPVVDQIVFALPANVTLNLTGIALPTIIDPLQVSAANEITINAGNVSGIFEINGAFTPGGATLAVLFDNLTLTQGFEQSGGAVLAQNNVELTIRHSHFNNNQTWLNPTKRGGAIYVTNNVVLRVESSSFTGNQGYEGGAISIGGASSLSIVASTFTQNRAVYGGALDLSGTGATIDQTTFTGNFATDYGGAISSLFADLSLTNSRFISNTAGFYGGAVDIDHGALTAVNSHFEQNATDVGGAIYGRQGSLSFTTTTFANNDANIDGGAIATGLGTTLSIATSTFESNSGEDGGAIAALGGNLTLSDTQLRHNQADDDGGAIYYTPQGGNEATLTLNGGLLTDNQAYSSGGAIYVSAGSVEATLVVVGSELQGNHAGSYGGAIYSTALGDSGLTGVHRNTVQISQARLISNQVDYEGGAIYIERGSLTIGNTLFEQNRVTSFETVSQPTRTINGSSGSNGGGAIAAREAILTIDQGIFSQNVSGGYGGGAITFDTSRANITNSRFVGNQATNGWGGALNCESGALNLSTLDLDIVRSTFIENSAYLDGGAISQLLCNGWIANSSVISNSANTEGGGISNWESKILVNNSTISSNHAGGNGGAIYQVSTYSQSPAKLELLNSTVVKNNASQGAGLYLDQRSGGDVYVSLFRSILAGNLRTNTLTPNDCTNSGGVFVSLGTNLTTDNWGSDCPLVSSDLQIPYAQLFSQVMSPDLVDDGHTSTHALLPNSQAVDATDQNICHDTLAGTDQRGILRIDGSCDIGAYELIKSAIDMRITAVGSNLQATRTVTATVYVDDSSKRPLQVVPIGFQVLGGTEVHTPTQLSDSEGQAVFQYVSTSPSLQASQAQAPDALTDHITVWSDLNNDGLLDSFEPQKTVDRDTAVELLGISAVVNVDGSLTLSWQTAAEANNAGFNLYRAEQVAGPYTKLNAQLIAAQGTGTGASYHFDDLPPKPGVYYYRLEDVDTLGGSQQYDPLEVDTGQGNEAQIRNYLPMVQR